MDAFLEIAKWVGLVFIAAVIAGFGKLLAEWIVKNRRKVVEAVKPKDAGAPAPPGPGPDDPKARKEEDKARKKADKEAWKQEKKARKAEED